MGDYELVEQDDGQIYVVNPNGQGLPMEFVELVFELNRQNPSFYRAWVELAESYVITGPMVGEA